MNVELIKRNYMRGLWTKAMVQMAVLKGVLTKEQYEEIVGEKNGKTGKGTEA